MKNWKDRLNAKLAKWYKRTLFGQPCHHPHWFVTPPVGEHNISFCRVCMTVWFTVRRVDHVHEGTSTLQ